MKTIDWSGINGVILLNALENCNPRTIGRGKVWVNYARGVLVGLMSGLMYAGFGFDEAWEQVLRKVEVDSRCVPSGWPTLVHYDAVKDVDICPGCGGAIAKGAGRCGQPECYRTNEVNS